MATKPTPVDDDGEMIIFRMTIRRNGKVIRRADGRPFKLVIRKKSS